MLTINTYIDGLCKLLSGKIFLIKFKAEKRKSRKAFVCEKYYRLSVFFSCFNKATKALKQKLIWLSFLRVFFSPAAGQCVLYMRGYLYIQFITWRHLTEKLTTVDSTCSRLFFFPFPDYITLTSTSKIKPTDS